MASIHSPEFTTHVEEILKRFHTPGLAIALIRGDEIDSTAFGYSKIGEQSEKCTSDSLFDIASASKSLTHASVALLVEDDKYPDVKYDSIMSSLLPDDFAMSTKERTDSVTVEDVLSHRTGLPRHDDTYFGINSSKPDDPRSITRNLRNLPLAAPLRTKHMYCNQMYTVASYLVEKTSGLEFATYLDKKFFGPLGMESSALQPSRARAKGLGDRLVTPYHWDKDPGQYRVVDYEETPEAQGAGSIITSVNDYAKYVRAVMNRQDPFTQDVYEGLVRARSFEDVDYEDVRPHHSASICTGGWRVDWFHGHMMVQHDGGVTGFSSKHFFIPSLRFGGCLFGNSESAEVAIEILTNELIEEEMGIPKEKREDWVKIQSDQEQAALQSFSEHKGEEKVRKELCPEGDESSRPLTTPLEAYTGNFFNAGYREMVVEIKGGKLFVDATDRSSSFTLTFDHVCDQDKFLAHLVLTGTREDEVIKAGFKVEDGKVTSLGLHMEYDLEEYIWFDRVE